MLLMPWQNLLRSVPLRAMVLQRKVMLCEFWNVGCLMCLLGLAMMGQRVSAQGQSRRFQVCLRV